MIAFSEGERKTSTKPEILLLTCEFPENDKCGNKTEEDSLQQRDSDKSQREQTIPCNLAVLAEEPHLLLSTVIEEAEQEQDSLDSLKEFIKLEHESECMGERTDTNADAAAVKANDNAAKSDDLLQPASETETRNGTQNETQNDAVTSAPRKTEPRATRSSDLVVNTFKNSAFDALLQTDVVTQLSFEPIEIEATTEYVNDTATLSTLPVAEKAVIINVDADEANAPKADRKSDAAPATAANKNAKESANTKPKYEAARQRKAARGDPKAPNEAEIKIALEIQELKQREEELRQQREEMQRLRLMKEAAETKTVCSDTCSIEIDGRCSPSSSELSTSDSYSGRMSLDSSFSSASKQSASNRSNHIRAKPFEVENDDSSAYSILIESPIEREMRVAREREEELRQAKNAAYSTKPVAGNDTFRIFASIFFRLYRCCVITHSQTI